MRMKQSAESSELKNPAWSKQVPCKKCGVLIDKGKTCRKYCKPCALQSSKEIRRSFVHNYFLQNREKCLTSIRRYNQTPRGKERIRIGVKKYFQTPKGRATRHRYNEKMKNQRRSKV